jgi:pyroglutamyl-peptidase
MRVALTGFGRFPGAAVNPSADLANALVRRRRPALAVALSCHIFATRYAAVDRDLPGLFAARPEVVVMFGLAARTRSVRIETRARNVRTVLFPDASGCRPERAAIRHGAQPQLTTNAPVQRLLAAVRTRPVAARLSRDAGRYVCNYAYWRALERAARQPDRPLVLFVHIPKVAPGSPAFRRLVSAAEALLVELIAASRR